MPETPVRKTATKKTARKTTRKVATKTAPTKKAVTQTRKAPTPLAAEKVATKNSQRLLFSGIGIFVLIIGVSVFIGVRGEGEIVLSTVLEGQRENASPEQLQAINNIGVQETKTRVVDGGLVGSTEPAVVRTPEPQASTTDETASSTEQSAEGENTQDINCDEVPETDGPEKLAWAAACEEGAEGQSDEAATGEETIIEDVSEDVFVQ